MTDDRNTNPYPRVSMKWIAVLLGTLSLNAFAVCISPKMLDISGNCVCSPPLVTSPLGLCITVEAMNAILNTGASVQGTEADTVISVDEPIAPSNVQVTVVDPVADPQTAVPVPTPVPVPEPVPTPNLSASSQDSLADTFASYDPATCQWTADLPRKLHTAPGCTRSTTNQICVGYVVCNAKEGGGKFVRTATCGGDKCGSSEAVSCVNDRAFYSSTPEENVGKYMSDRVKTQVIGQ